MGEAVATTGPLRLSKRIIAGSVRESVGSCAPKPAPLTVTLVPGAAALVLEVTVASPVHAEASAASGEWDGEGDQSSRDQERFRGAA